MIITNLVDDRTMVFSSGISALYAVCYGHCEDNNMLSALFSAIQDNRFAEFTEKLPVSIGNVSVACGDWAVM